MLLPQTMVTDQTELGKWDLIWVAHLLCHNIHGNLFRSFGPGLVQHRIRRKPLVSKPECGAGCALPMAAHVTLCQYRWRTEMPTTTHVHLAMSLAVPLHHEKLRAIRQSRPHTI